MYKSNAALFHQPTTQSFQHIRKILGKNGGPFHVFSADRMYKTYLIGVETLSLNAFEWLSVNIITKYGMTDICHVYSYLMSAACFKSAPDK